MWLFFEETTFCFEDGLDNGIILFKPRNYHEIFHILNLII